MVVIRLARVGRNKYPVYRIVAADKKRAATGKFLAILGQYNPHTKEIKLKTEAIEKYLASGAQASDRVLRLLIAQGVKVPAWAKTHDRNKAPKSEPAAVEEKPAAEAPAPDETPVEGVEVAAEATDSTEAKATEVKDNVGTAKELEDETKAAESTEAVAEAVEKTAEAK